MIRCKISTWSIKDKEGFLPKKEGKKTETFGVFVSPSQAQNIIEIVCTKCSASLIKFTKYSGYYYCNKLVSKIK